MNYDNHHNDKDFDSFLKEKYKNHTLNPDEELWEGINSRINQKKLQSNIKQVRTLKYISASLAACLIISFFYFEHRLRTNEKPEIMQETDENIRIQNGYQKDNISTVASISQKQEPINTNTLQNISGLQNNKIIAKNGDNRNQIKLNELDDNSINPVMNKQKTEQSYHTKPLVQKKEDIYITQSTANINNNNNLIQNDSSLFSLQGTNTINIDNNDTGEHAIINEKNFSENSIERNETSIDPYTSNDVGGVNNTDETELNSVTTSIPTDSIITNDGINVQILDNLVNSDSQINFPEPSTDPQKRKYFIDGFFSPELSYRFITQNPEYEQTKYNKAYFNARDKADFTFSAGLYGGMSLNERMNLLSGIYYSQYAQKFKTEAANILHNTDQGYFLYTSTGVANLTLSSSDSIPAETFLKSSIRYNYLNIPLIVDYRIFRYQRINFGINFNFLLWQELNWESENSNGNTEPHYDEVSGLKTAMLSLIIGTTYERPITQNISLIINPSLKMHVMALSKSSPVHAYPYSWGLHTGIRYSF